MLNFTKLFLLSLILVTAACKKDDPESSGLVGTWNLSEATCNDGTSKTIIPGAGTIELTFTATGKDYAATVTFKDDGTYTSAGSYTSVLNLNLGGQPSIQEIPIPDFAGSGKWVLNGSTMTVTDAQGTTSTADVLENTDNKFRYKVSINRIDNSNPDYSIEQKGSYVFTLTR